MNPFKRYALNFASIVAILFLVYGCGGGGGGSPVPTTTVSGSVMAGPANGSTILVKTVAGTVVAGPVTTLSDGTYTLAIPTSALAEDLVFEASSGTFDDEAEQTAIGHGVTMGTLSAYVPAGGLGTGSNVSLDPSSTIVRKLVAGGMTKAAAEASFNTAFGFTPDVSVKPAFAVISSACTSNQRLAGVRVAAFSQLTKDLGLTPDKQFELIQSLADDLSDGTLDGKKAGAAVTASGVTIPDDIANRFVQALVTFQTGALNQSNLTADQVGALPFNKTALTASYKVEYLPGTMAAAQGKTTFKIRLSSRSSGAPASGRTVVLLPYMHMATKSHSTPVDAVIEESGTPGTYDCTVYYLMSTSMNGVSMGFWELRVTVDGTETAIFYPTVAMAMGTTARTTLNGVNDSVAVGGVNEKRAYNLFFDGLTGSTGNYTFKLFVSAKESLTSWPGVSVGSQLHDETGTAWTVTAMTVDVSTDGTTWLPAADGGSGHWSAAGLTGLTSGATSPVYVRVTVNGETKMTLGNVGYATFSVVVP